jgi:hypothetical protein
MAGVGREFEAYGGGLAGIEASEGKRDAAAIALRSN